MTSGIAKPNATALAVLGITDLPPHRQSSRNVVFGGQEVRTANHRTTEPNESTNVEPRTFERPNLEPRTSNREPRTANREPRTSNLWIPEARCVGETGCVRQFS